MIDFSFDDKAEEAQAAAEEIAAKMVKEITVETEANIRNLIIQAIREGKSPYEAAIEIRDLIGLTAAQGQAVKKYRQQLIDAGLSSAKVEEKVEAYANELLAVRAENIARNEIMDALNEGQSQAWRQAQDEGVLSDKATKEWILSEDACPLCEEAAQQEPVPISSEFRGGDPPLHPRCRCTIGIASP
jgi:hypothetical protein